MKLSEDARAELKGAVSKLEAGELSIKTYPPVVLITEALDSAGVDATATEKAIGKLKARQQRALEDRAITPAELNIPKPDGYTDERHVELCASYARGYREGRENRRKTITTIATTVAAVAAAGGLIWTIYVA